MKRLTGNEIRKTWLDFFKSKGHAVEKGASLIPHNDPTLLWINSGVAALKKYFDGSEVPPSRRITNVQKSIRTNDIENVGFTARHHTFFEMLGNFSIGDYFRKEVIEWAFEILTSPKYFGMDKDKLYFTYLPSDLDTYNNWIKQGVDKDHLIPLEGNFWQIGEGPCGPNTEVFFDRGEKYDPKHIGIDLLKKDMENDRYIEIWGIVFSQYNAVEGVKREDYKELPSKNIDTGAGLERIACVLQETPTNFETDLFLPIIKKVETIATLPYKEGNYMPYRVIADHIRAISFALLDGENFSNEGRGYVLRRLLRRAMRYAKKIGINKPFLYTLVDTVAEIMEPFYTEFKGNTNRISNLVKAEEEKFIETLSSGEELLNSLIEKGHKITGKDAFKLYDTYGFPFDLTKEILLEKGMEINEEEFNIEMSKQKERARSSRKEYQSMKKQSKDLLEFTSASTFIYENEIINAKVIGLFKDGVRVKELSDEGEVIFDKTTFYAESGGQVADTGFAYNDNAKLEVLDVIKAPNKQHLHFVKVLNGKVKENDVFTLEISSTQRELTRRNHTATHLLQSALDIVLGDQIAQQGSYVCKDYLRFDFNHNEKLSLEQLNKIEDIVNSFISKGINVDTKILPIEEANKLGAKSFFSDKYGKEVRVVSVGDVSMEFCGGTHVSNTSEIGVFKIESEESVASGVRRIQARTSLGAIKLIKEKETILNELVKTLGASSISELNSRVNALNKKLDEQKNMIDSLTLKIANSLSSSIENEFVIFNGYDLLVKHVKDAKKDDLLKLLDSLKGKKQNYIIVLVGGNDGACPVLVSVSKKGKDNGLKAGVIAKEVATILGGSGGGNPEIAFGQGKDLSKFAQVQNKVKEMLE